MKSIVILFIALLMLTKPLWPIADYVINYDYISKVLCENKEKPEAKCDGKCYLMQQLANDMDNSSNKNPFKTKIQHITYFELLLQFAFDFNNKTTLQNNFKTPQDLVSNLYTLDNLHPPELS